MVHGQYQTRDRQPRVSLRTGTLASELWMPCAGSAEGEGGGDACGGQ